MDRYFITKKVVAESVDRIMNTVVGNRGNHEKAGEVVAKILAHPAHDRFSQFNGFDETVTALNDEVKNLWTANYIAVHIYWSLGFSERINPASTVNYPV